MRKSSFNFPELKKNTNNWKWGKVNENKKLKAMISNQSVLFQNKYFRSKLMGIQLLYKRIFANVRHINVIILFRKTVESQHYHKVLGVTKLC